jgi:hypothetical protein
MRRSGSVRILDDAVGSWGHVMVDELEQRTSSA